jgi:type IX secretion system PorP/SprF family membrane protein
MKKSTILFLILTQQLSAQDIHFSNMEQTPQQLNPGLIGLNYAFGATSLFRNQWSSVGSPFSTVSLAVDGRLTEEGARSNGILAIGASFFSDKSGLQTITSNQFSGNVAYQLVLDRNNSIGIGLQGGFNQRGIGNTNGRWGNQYNGENFDATISSGENITLSQINFVDVGSGLTYAFRPNRRNNASEGKEFTVGLAGYHLNRPKYNFSSSDDLLGIRWSAFASAKLRTNNLFFLIPSIYFQQQEKYNQLVIGSGFKYLMKEGSKITGYSKSSGITFGLYNRWKDAVIARFGVEISSFSSGISYDFTVSKLSEVKKLQGGFELYLKYAILDKSLWRGRL